MQKVMHDLTGMYFTRLHVDRLIARPAYRSGRGDWHECTCKCGTKTVASALMLRHKMVKSCGCLRRETAAENLRRYRKNRALRLVEERNAEVRQFV